MGLTVDPNAAYRTLGGDPNALSVTPPAFDPNNPLGLTAAAPGYLPPELRPERPDPDLQVVPGGYTPTGLGQPDLTPDQINANNKALVDWGNMDQAYWSPREQDPLPLVLGAAGLIAAPFALSALGIGGAAAGAGGAGSAAAGGAGALGAGAAGTAGALGAGAAGAGATVSELVVTAAAQGLSIPAIAAAVGIPAATVGSILSQSGGSNVINGGQGTDSLAVQPAATTPSTAPDLSTTVSPVTVTAAPATSSALPAVLGAGALGAGALAAGAGGGGGGGLGDYTGAGVDPGLPAATGPDAALGDTSLGAAVPPSLTAALKTLDPSAIGKWIAANPLQAAELGLLTAGALGGAAGSNNGSYAIPTGNGAPGTLSSLNPVFSASLPAPTNAPHTARPLPQGVDWNRYAIAGPAQSFFTDVPQSGPAQFAVPSVAQIQQQGANNLGVSNIDAVRKAFRGYAKGGKVKSFAVHGAGTGRSDSIPARLSDGEYVMDAETVSMLGDGSSAAGAKKLDKLRVNLRKAKGKQLARGRFSVAAKDPEAYYRGGRTDA